jgi:hypothetical protein
MLISPATLRFRKYPESMRLSSAACRMVDAGRGQLACIFGLERPQRR